MNKKIRAILFISAIVNIIFAILAFISMIYGLMYVVVYEDYGSVLPLVYSFFHLCIMVLGSVLSIMAIRKKKSTIMRTIMYVNDYNELTPSIGAKIFALILAFIGLAAGIYFGLTFILKGLPLIFPMMLRLDLVNVGFYLFIMGILFFTFPYLYDIRIDIEERKQKYMQKKNKGEAYEN